jgi:hypothetical protein
MMGWTATGGTDVGMNDETDGSIIVYSARQHTTLLRFVE